MMDSTQAHMQDHGANQVSQLLGKLLPSMVTAGTTDTSLFGSFVGGELIAGTGEQIDLVNPATGGVFMSYLDAGEVVVKQAAEAAEAGQKQWWAKSAARTWTFDVRLWPRCTRRR